MAHRILLVDPDLENTAFLEHFLDDNGLDVRIAETGESAHRTVANGGSDLLILEAELPDVGGLEMVRAIRKVSDIPIIFLSSRAEAMDRIIGIEIGADDYMAKPFEPRELLARTRALLRRLGPHDGLGRQQLEGTYKFGGMTLDVPSRTLRDRDDLPIRLTATEFSIMQCLVEAAGEVVTRDHLMTLLYGKSAMITDRAIDAHIARLRRKIGSVGVDRNLVRTVHGTGYHLAASARLVDAVLGG